MGDTIVTIDRLAGLGDGVAETASGRIHVPLTAPGDHGRVAIREKGRGELIELLSPGPPRVEPPCRHFGRCGGCALQHLDPGFIAEWKRDVIKTSIEWAGIDPSVVRPTISIPPGTRRRATLAARRLASGIVLGFAERKSHRLVDLAECPLLVPALARLVAPLRAALSALLQPAETADIAITESDTGIDLVLIRKREPTLRDRERLAGLAEACDLARISWRPGMTRAAEPVAARRMPAVRLGVQLVPLPPGGFLQPSAAGERTLIDLVLKGLDESSGPYADLFSGSGTFALPLSARGPVTAYDGDDEAIASLKAARNPAVSVHRRDLFRDPLTPTELEPFGAAVIDPPRAGAEVQCKSLSASAIPTIAYVSCNPATFARDAAILIQGGYRLIQATPVDQFTWSPHVELVGVFQRGAS
jgi:23S rRNA (uracil1939-C5)-methyltransferase